jgi:hypothetical protein
MTIREMAVRTAGDPDRVEHPHQGGHRGLAAAGAQVVAVDVEQRGAGLHGVSLPAGSPTA